MIVDELARATVRWVGGLYVGFVLLQRFAVPGLPVALLLPFSLAGAGWGLARGLATVDYGRLAAWLTGAGATALVIPVQSYVLHRSLISVGSWALFMTVWLPFTLHLVDRRLQTYLAFLRVVVTTSAVTAAGCVLMMLTQYAGLAYRDYLADVVPSSWLLNGFVITYPISYGSPLYRANAWIGLEPSMISLQLGVGLIAALLIGTRLATNVLLLAGLVAATSGSGFAIMVVALLVVLSTSARTLLRRYLAPAAVVMVVGLGSPMGQTIFGRLGAGGSVDPSLSLRALQPYTYLWPSWVSDLSGVLFGEGPGSSQRLVEGSGLLGLLVPTPIKIFYDYGLLAGAAIAVMILLCFVGGPSRALAVALVVSLWTLQPGTTSIVVILPVLLLVTWWSPRPENQALEDRFGSAAGDIDRRSPLDVGGSRAATAPGRRPVT